MSTGQLVRESEPASRRPAESGPRRIPSALGSTASLRFRRVRALILLLVVLLLVCGSIRLIGSAGSAVGPDAAADRAADAPPPPTSESASAALAESVAARTQGIKGDTAVGVLDLGTGVTATSAPDKALPTASIVKVDILASLLLQKDGELTQGQEALAKR